MNLGINNVELRRNGFRYEQKEMIFSKEIVLCSYGSRKSDEYRSATFSLDGKLIESDMPQDKLKECLRSFPDSVEFLHETLENRDFLKKIDESDGFECTHHEHKDGVITWCIDLLSPEKYSVIFLKNKILGSKMDLDRLVECISKF